MTNKIENILFKVLNKKFNFIEDVTFDNGDAIITVNPIKLNELFPRLTIDHHYLESIGDLTYPFMEIVFENKLPMDVIQLREDLESLICSLIPNQILFVLFKFTSVNNNLSTIKC